MQTYNIHEAKTHLSALIEKAVSGEPFIIAKAGRPLVTVSRIVEEPQPMRTGFLKGSISVPQDFDSMGEDSVIEMFVGEL